VLQISHLEFVHARIDCRVELRKASVGEVKKSVGGERRSMCRPAAFCGGQAAARAILGLGR
jgi:hypothetical protein